MLSVAKALSIQAHPDKALAERLYRERPDMYRDANHKPEIAVALGPFEALCQHQICKHLKEVPELRKIAGEVHAEAFERAVATAAAAASTAVADSDPETKRCLKALYCSLMTHDDAAVREAVTGLAERLAKETSGKVPGESDPLDLLIVRLAKQYPGDVGVLCPYLLNYVHLEEGDSVFLAANEPHAYLSGNCVECMATSDNVVRGGLAPKFKDVPVLAEMLTYNMGPALVQRGVPSPSEGITVYPSPVPEFLVSKVEVDPRGTFAMRASGPTVVLCVAGSGEAAGKGFKRGSVLLAEREEGDIAITGGEDGALLFIAEPNSP